jgi:hypothetical protein
MAMAKLNESMVTKDKQQDKAAIRNEALKDATLYFLVVLGSYLDDLVRDGRLTSDVRRDIYMTLKDYAIQGGYLTECASL